MAPGSGGLQLDNSYQYRQKSLTDKPDVSKHLTLCLSKLLPLLVRPEVKIRGIACDLSATLKLILALC